MFNTTVPSEHEINSLTRALRIFASEVKLLGVVLLFTFASLPSFFRFRASVTRRHRKTLKTGILVQSHPLRRCDCEKRIPPLGDLSQFSQQSRFHFESPFVESLFL